MGHGEEDVLYIGFTGEDAVPGKSGAAWAAATRDDFSGSIKILGDRLISKL